MCPPMNTIQVKLPHMFTTIKPPTYPIKCFPSRPSLQPQVRWTGYPSTIISLIFIPQSHGRLSSNPIAPSPPPHLEMLKIGNHGNDRHRDTRWRGYEVKCYSMFPWFPSGSITLLTAPLTIQRHRVRTTSVGDAASRIHSLLPPNEASAS